MRVLAKGLCFSALLGVLLAGCGVTTDEDQSTARAAKPPAAMSTEVEEICLRTVKMYVGETRGWDEKTYDVIEEQSSSGEKGFSVRHEDDMKSLLPEGGRKSFHVDLDLSCGEVLRELRYQ